MRFDLTDIIRVCTDRFSCLSHSIQISVGGDEDELAALLAASSA